MAKKITRKSLLEAAEEMGVKTTIKGKPVSNEKLLELIEDSMDDHADEDGNFEIEVLADIAAARDGEKDIVVVGDDPTVPRKAAKPAKEEKPAPAKAKKGKPAPADDDDDNGDGDDDEEEEVKPAKGKKAKAAAPADDEEEEVKPAKGKKAKAAKPAKEEKEKKPKANTDRWKSREGSSAYDINQILFKCTSPKKGLTGPQIFEKLCEIRDDVTSDRMNGHLRRLWLTSNLITRDEKGRYYIPQTAE